MPVLIVDTKQVFFYTFNATKKFLHMQKLFELNRFFSELSNLKEAIR